MLTKFCSYLVAVCLVMAFIKALVVTARSVIDDIEEYTRRFK